MGESKQCEYCCGKKNPELRNSTKKEDLIELSLNRKWQDFCNTDHEVNITKEYWRELIFSTCKRCDTTGTINLTVDRKEPIILDIKVNTVDRKDSSKGYIWGNVQTLCHDCNRWKNSHSEEEFDEIVNRVVDHQIKLRENNKPVGKIVLYSDSYQEYPHLYSGEEYTIQEYNQWIYLNETGL